MLDFRPYANLSTVPFGKGEADYIVHLPQQATPLSSLVLSRLSFKL